MNLYFSSYISLAGEAKQIRLLHLGKRGSPQVEDQSSMSCTFSTVSLDKYPEYEALSYVWGDTSKEKTIQIDNEAVGITRNLHEALAQLQLPNRERILWADAICINQDDNLERTHQVSIMQHIYQRATKVVIYLGPTWVGCERLFEFFQATGQDRDLHIFSHQEPCVVVGGFRGLTPDLRRHIGRFFDLAWWTRVWTVQEFVLAKSADIYCGPHVLSGDMLLKGVNNVLYHRDSCCQDCDLTSIDDDADLETGVSLQRSKNIQDIRNWGGSCPLLHLCSSTRFREAHDPRDKIFGLLGMVPAPYAEAIIPDYTQSVEEIYREAAVASVSLTGTLEFLSICRGDRSLSLLPSFIPDWTAWADQTTATGYMKRVASFSFHDASSGTASKFNFISSVEADFRGSIFDVITETRPPFWELPKTKKSLRSWRQFAGVNARFVRRSAIDAMEAEIGFAVTLCGNMNVDDEKGLISLRGISSEELLLRFKKWEAWIASNRNDMAHDKDVEHFEIANNSAMLYRRFAKTSKGHLALVPNEAKEGDVIAVLAGGKVPYVLRLALNKDDSDVTCRSYTFIGDTYVHGIMDGEAWPGDSSKLSVIRMI